MKESRNINRFSLNPKQQLLPYSKTAIGSNPSWIGLLGFVSILPCMQFWIPPHSHKLVHQDFYKVLSCPRVPVCMWMLFGCPVAECWLDLCLLYLSPTDRQKQNIVLLQPWINEIINHTDSFVGMVLGLPCNWLNDLQAWLFTHASKYHHSDLS